MLATGTAIAVACALWMPARPAAAQGWNQLWYEAPVRPRLRLRPKPRPQPPIPDHVAKEPFGEVPKGPLQLIISIDQQKLHLYSDGTEVAETLIATGVPGHPTPVGVFSVIQKDRLHHSNIYSGAPMPYMQRITWSGVALHEGGNLGHPASHGCVRLPHDFATRLWILTRLGARVIIARPELRPQQFADPHLFVHKEMSPPVPSASMPVTEKPIKTAQSLPEDQKSDVPAAGSEGPARPQEPAKTASDASPSAKPDSAATITPVADTHIDRDLRPSVSDMAVSDTVAAPSSEAPAAPAGEAPHLNQSSPTDTPQTMPAVVSPAVPVPPIKPTEIARSAPKTPISIFVSGKEKKIYVRQDFTPLFSAPVTIEHPEQRLGTHVFTALSYLDDHARFRWNVVSLPGESLKPAPKTWANASRMQFEQKFGRGKRRDEMAAAPAVPPPPQTPQEALARIQIPQDTIDRISELIIPGSSLIISDQGLGGETGDGTDFIVVMR